MGKRANLAEQFAAEFLAGHVKLSMVLDRELEEEKSHDPSDPRIHCPVCVWSPRKEGKWFCTCGFGWQPVAYIQDCEIRTDCCQ
jgi:hypothetical protein